VNATLGFERLAKTTAMPLKSLHRMLSPKGNPSMDNLAAIFDAVRKCLKVSLKAHTVNLQKVAWWPWRSLRHTYLVRNYGATHKATRTKIVAKGQVGGWRPLLAGHGT
jgi:hypothetical protein